MRQECVHVVCFMMRNSVKHRASAQTALPNLVENLVKAAAVLWHRWLSQL